MWLFSKKNDSTQKNTCLSPDTDCTWRICFDSGQSDKISTSLPHERQEKLRDKTILQHVTIPWGTLLHVTLSKSTICNSSLIRLPDSYSSIPSLTGHCLSRPNSATNKKDSIQLAYNWQFTSSCYAIDWTKVPYVLDAVIFHNSLFATFEHYQLDSVNTHLNFIMTKRKKHKSCITIYIV